MLKQSLIFLLLSVLVVIFAQHAHKLLVYLDMLYVFINFKLAPIFSQGGLGPLVRKVTLLVLIPPLISGIPALSYRLIKGKDMPYFFESTWCIWLLIVLSNLLIRY